MNSFNIKRFGQTFRWMLATHLQTFLVFTVGCAAAVFLLEMIMIAFGVTADGGNYVPFLYSDVSMFFVLFLVIYALVAISTLFSYYLKKPQREAFLMLPSTNLEKYLGAVIYVTVVWTLAGFLAFAVGDTLRMVVRALVYGNEWYSLVPIVSDFLFDGFSSVHSDNINIVSTSYKVTWYIFFASSIFWIHSLYILGGTLMRKYSFVVASLTAILFVTLYVWVGIKFNLSGFYSETFIDGQSVDALRQSGALDANGPWSAKSVRIEHRVGAIAYGLCVLFPLFSIFNYWASYRIFKGFQLITNKWTNYDFFK